MKNKSFGLDIGATNIKAVWLSKEKNGFLFNTARISPTPVKGMISESPLDQDEMAKAIKKLIDEAKITTNYVNIALPENQVYTRIIEMPVLSDKELSSAIFWEAEQHIPVPLADLTLDWKTLKRPENQKEDQKMEVLLVGAPTALIDKYEKVLAMSGIIINSIETEILSVVRALSYPFNKDKVENFPPTMIVNIGAVSTSLAIVKNGVLVFTFSTPVGGAAINRALATDFGFTVSQAEEYKKTYGVSQQFLGGKIGQATTPILLAIISEIKKAFAFYKEKYKEEEPVRQIILAGGTAKLPDINTFFAQQCGVETIISNPWTVLINHEVPKEIIDNAPDYAIAVGLAIRDNE